MEEAEKVINIARIVCIMVKGNEHIEFLKKAVAEFDEKARDLWI
jgi:hypothetical protein